MNINYKRLYSEQKMNRKNIPLKKISLPHIGIESSIKRNEFYLKIQHTITVFFSSVSSHSECALRRLLLLFGIIFAARLNKFSLS